MENRQSFMGKLIIVIGLLASLMAIFGLPNVRDIWKATFDEVEEIDNADGVLKTSLNVVVWECFSENFSGVKNFENFRAEKGRLTGARVTLDGKDLGLTPLDDIFIEEGKRLIEISKEGCMTEKFVFIAVKNRRHVVEKVLFAKTLGANKFRNRYIKKKILMKKAEAVRLMVLVIILPILVTILLFWNVSGFKKFCFVLMILVMSLYFYAAYEEKVFVADLVTPFFEGLLVSIVFPVILLGLEWIAKDMSRGRE